MTRTSRFKSLLSSSLILLSLAAPAAGESTDDSATLFDFSEPTPTQSFRFPRPASLIAENRTVITADEIARLNAHTVADVLHTLPGVQLDEMQTPGSLSFFQILGASARHILVLIDGVPQNYVGSENVAYVGHIPVQMVERIEVVKGAASAAWGSALGGVVNIVTKDPAPDRAAGGALSASIGKSSTSDLRAEVSGSVDRVGYYLFAGRLGSNGLTSGNDIDAEHGFGKFTYHLAGGGKATLGLDARHTDQGVEESKTLRGGFHNTGHTGHTAAYLSLYQPLDRSYTLELSARGGEREIGNRRNFTNPWFTFYDITARESHAGGGISLGWRGDQNELKGGLEFERTQVRMRETASRIPFANFDLNLERVSAFLNGTYTVGRLSILPGVRVDRLNLMEDPTSFNLGATFRLSESTLLRAYAARGYSMPIIANIPHPDGVVRRDLQHVWTVQTGVETAEVPNLWLKATLFYSKVWNIESFDGFAVDLQEQHRQGVELEMRTVPLFHTSLSASYYFADARDHESGEKLSAALYGPRQSLKLGLDYEDREVGLTAALRGNYSKLHAPGPYAKNKGILWDLHLTQKLVPGSELSPELFLSLRNITDAEQYHFVFRRNAPRWLEAGMRCHF